MWVAARYNMYLLGAVGLAFVAFATPIGRLFTAEPEVVADGADALRVVASGYLFYAYGMVLTQSLTGPATRGRRR